MTEKSNTWTLLPPGTDKQNGCLVATEQEWIIAGLDKGDNCWIHLRKWPEGEWRHCTFRSSYWYDGMIARVFENDPDELIEHSLFPDFGDLLTLMPGGCGE